MSRSKIFSAAQKFKLGLIEARNVIFYVGHYEEKLIIDRKGDYNDLENIDN